MTCCEFDIDLDRLCAPHSFSSLRRYLASRQRRVIGPRGRIDVRLCPEIAILLSPHQVTRASQDTPLVTILHEALFVVYRNIVVARLREVLTPDDVASAAKPATREEQIEHHELVAPIQDVYSVVDLASANHLINLFGRRLLPPAAGRAAQELMEAELRRDLRQIRLWRDPVAHPTESNAPTPDDAIGSIEAAQRVLDRLGLGSQALNRFIARIRASSAKQKTLAPDENYALPTKMQLYGRDRDLELLYVLLANGDSNLVTVTGPGGAGKTSIAIEAVRRVASSGSRNPRFLRLETVNQPSQVLTQIQGAIGLPMQRPDEKSVISTLRSTPVILLLDNLEQALSASALIGSLASRCEKSLFVATSRERLGVKLERVFALPTLAVPASDDSIGDIRANPSVQVFVNRLHAGRGRRPVSDEDYRNIASIVRALDGLCLAIELIAALSVDRKLATIKEQIPRLLTIPVSDPTLPARHRTLVACLQWSWDLASKDEKALLMRITHVFGDISQSTLNGMCSDLGFESVEDVAAVAVRRNLLQHTHDGYSLLEPIRQFMDGQIGGDERRHALTMLLVLARRLADALPGERMPWLEDLIEVFNLGSNALVLLESFYPLVHRDQAILFLLSWCPLSWRFDPTFGRWDDELTKMLTLFAGRRSDRPSQLVCKALIELARLHHHYQRNDESLRSASAALREALRLDDSALARSAMATYKDAIAGDLQARRRLMRQLIRTEPSEALFAAIWALAAPGEYDVTPDDEGADAVMALAVAGLQTIASGRIAEANSEAAANALFQSYLILNNYPGLPRRLYFTQTQLAEKSGDQFALYEALIALACDLLHLGDDLWYTAVFDATGRHDYLPVVEISEGTYEPFRVHWPRGRAESELLRSLERAISIRPTLQASAMLAALSIRRRDIDTVVRCIGFATQSEITNHGDALLLSAFGVWAAHHGKADVSASVVADLIPWLASNGNQMAAFGLYSSLRTGGMELARRR